MKLLGTAFLVIGLICALHGLGDTPYGIEKSWLRLQEELAEREVAKKEEYLSALAVLVSAQSSVSPSLLANVVAARESLKESRAKLTEAEERRLSSIKWHFVPAVCFAVLGLILLVLPTGPHGSSSGLSDALLSNPPKLPPKL